MGREKLDRGRGEDGGNYPRTIKLDDKAWDRGEPGRETIDRGQNTSEHAGESLRMRGIVVDTNSTTHEGGKKRKLNQEATQCPEPEYSRLDRTIPLHRWKLRRLYNAIQHISLCSRFTERKERKKKELTP